MGPHSLIIPSDFLSDGHPGIPVDSHFLKLFKLFYFSFVALPIVHLSRPYSTF